MNSNVKRGLLENYSSSVTKLDISGLYWHYICMIIDRLREQLSLCVVVWNSVLYSDHSRPNKARPPTNHTTPEGPVQPCGPVRFSVAAGAWFLLTEIAQIDKSRATTSV